MKLLTNVPVYLLALIFLVFGSNYFLHFIPMQPMSGDAGTFAGLLFTSKFLLFVKIVELACGVLMILPKTRALALLLIAPISVNILLFELLIAHQPGIGILVVLLNAVAIYVKRTNYMSIIQ